MKKSIVKRIGSLLTVLLLTASIFSNGLVAFAADTKHTQSKVLDWSYNFEGSGLKNAYDPLTGGNTNDAFRYGGRRLRLSKPFLRLILLKTKTSLQTR